MIAVAPHTENVPVLYSQKPTQNRVGHSDQAEQKEQCSILINAAKSEPFLDSDVMGPDPMAALGIADPPVTANGRASTKHDENDLHLESSCFSDSTIHSTDRKMAVDVLKIIESYGVDYEKTGGSWKGLESFVPIVMEQVKQQEPIRMILPAFPFKSPNARDKVLGTMPDFGEELALSHLNGLCDSIGKVYEPGADVYISSDGLVYNGRTQNICSRCSCL